MPTESIWTALPTGIAPGKATLSVHVSPRLRTGTSSDGVLGDFPALATWAPGDLNLEVVIGGTPYEGTVVSAPDPSVWAALFPATTTAVRSYEVVDNSTAAIHTYPLTKIVEFLQTHWTQVAMDSPTEFPAIVDLLAAGFEDIRFSGREGALRWNETRALLEAQLNAAGVVDTTAASDTTFDFVQLEDFFASLDASDPAVEAAVLEPVEPPKLDFHSAVQFVNQHPTLMRLLGLVLDVEVDLGRTVIPDGPATVQVKPSAEQLGSTTVRTPTTQAAVAGARFDAVPRPGATHLTPGWLRLDDTGQFQVVQVEADGGGLKAVDFAGNLGSKLENATVDTPTTAALPTLRTDGFSVARVGKASATKATLAAGVAKEADLGNDTLDVYLDDVVRGFRMDVWDSITGNWHSTMERTGQYEIGSATVVPVTDEGFVGTTATKKPRSDDLYLPEEMFWWDGWSLVVPRPGKTLTPDQEASEPLIDRPANDPGPDIDARIHFDVLPGSLPRLRYGAEYRFRARVVDLAGNSLAPDVGDDTHATPPKVFGRFEPPQTPPVLLRTSAGPGESIETVALRSNYDVAADPDGVDRHLIPGKVGQLAVEQHGLVDTPDPDASTYQMLAELDAATLANHDDVDDPTAAILTYNVDSLPVTWAPDPLVKQHALRFLDGAHAGHVEHPAVMEPSGWPDYRATRLHVVEATTPAQTPTYDTTSGVLTVPLAKAAISTVRLSTIVDVDQLPALGLWQWILAAVAGQPNEAQVLSALEQQIRNGEHWMFEPYRELTLVHAVRQPLRTPEYATPLLPNRGPNATFVRLSGRLEYSRASTSRLDGLASWRDPVDNGPGTDPPVFVDDTNPPPRIVDRQRAFQIDVEHGPEDTEDFEQLRVDHELGDTKHRVVTYRAVATTRFGEYFTSSTQVPFDGAGSTVVLDTGNPAKGVVPGSIKVTYPEGTSSVPLTEGTHFSVDAGPGSLTFAATLPNGAHAFPSTGTTLTVVYLVPPITRVTTENPTAHGEHGPRIVSVPSSSRPHAPRVRYVLPTFGWSDGPVLENGHQVGIESQRSGGGLRIYLERPWWTSGDGELLGVVTWPRAEEAFPPDLEQAATPSEDADARRPYVTQWGQDPIYRSRLLPRRYPRLSTFTDAADTGTDLSLPELGNQGPLVNVAGHTVGFDPDRDLWYCDISVDTGPAYLPFIRLALARWQPDSIAHAELSPVVLADFVQLAPDRHASVTFDDAESSIVGLTLSGPTHIDTAVSGSTNPGRAIVIVEERMSAFDGDLAWAPVGEPIECSSSVVLGTGLWTTEVHLPGERLPGRYRLIVEQFETLPEEPQSKGMIHNPHAPTKTAPAPRLVHTDIIPI